MVGMYLHATFNLNPRASSDRHPAAQLSAGKACRSHASERDHRHRRIGEPREAHPGNLRRGNGLRAVDAPGFELGLAMEEIAGTQPDVKAIMMGQHGFIHGTTTRRPATTTRSTSSRRPQITSKPNMKPKAATRPLSAARNTAARSGSRATPPSPPSCPGCAAGSPQQKRFVGTVQDDEKILRFVNSHDAAASGRAWHELSRPFPAHQDQAALCRLESANRGCRRLEATSSAAGLAKYRQDYAAYYDRSANTPIRPPCATRIRPSS